jgi:hypothetical protein
MSVVPPSAAVRLQRVTNFDFDVAGALDGREGVDPEGREVQLRVLAEDLRGDLRVITRGVESAPVSHDHILSATRPIASKIRASVISALSSRAASA